MTPYLPLWRKPLGIMGGVFKRRATPLVSGARVRVRRDPVHGPGPWPSEPSGTIVTLSGARRPYEVVTTTRGKRKTYWVEFDEPQFDVEGDTQYAKAQVLEDHLEVLSQRP